VDQIEDRVVVLTGRNYLVAATAEFCHDPFDPVRNLVAGDGDPDPGAGVGIVMLVQV
jgi:hypothetical protein